MHLAFLVLSLLIAPELWAQDRAPTGPERFLRVSGWEARFSASRVTSVSDASGRSVYNERTTGSATLRTREIRTEDGAAYEVFWKGPADAFTTIDNRYTPVPSPVECPMLWMTETGRGRSTGAEVWLEINLEVGSYSVTLEDIEIEVETANKLSCLPEERERITTSVGQTRSLDVTGELPSEGLTLSGHYVQDDIVIEYEIWPAGQDPDRRISVAIQGPACGCIDAENPQGASFTFFATASGGGGGTFSEFRVRSEGAAPRTVRSQGGGAPILELAATRETGTVVLSITYEKDGKQYVSPDHSVEFCAIDAIRLAGGSEDLSFDGGQPGRLIVKPSSDAWLNGQPASSLLRWELQQIEGVTQISPQGATGGEVEFTYEGLPESNNAFGAKELTAAIEQGSCACRREKRLRVFFSPLARNHPRVDAPSGSPYRDTPNWFYYWTQTAAQQNLDMRFVRYLQRIPSDEGEPIPSARFEHTEDRIFLSDPVATEPCQARYDQASRTPTGRTARGIDCFGETLRHEWQHRTDFLEWWPSGLPTIIPHVIVYDSDLDFVPAEVEKRNPGCSDFAKVSCDGLPPINGVTDRELNAYWVGWTWPLGSADEEDWSCGGKQWKGGTCP